MDFIRRFIEQKISQAVDAPVRMGGFSFSPLSGVVEVRDLVVGSFLTVKRIEAKLAIARALQQEIVIRSLVIDGPSLTLTPQPLIRKRLGTSDPTEPSKRWEFEAHKVLLVGGRIEFRDGSSGYIASLENLAGSLESDSGGIEIVLAADSLGRRDKPVELGTARLIGKLPGLADWSAILSSSVELELSAGSVLKLMLQSPSVTAGPWTGRIQLDAELKTLLALIPSNVQLPAGLRG